MATHVHSWDDIINANIDFTLETSGKNEVIWENDNEDLDAFYLIQGESNARALIFEMPRMVENHDNSLVDTVRIHYQNIGSTTQQSRGMYEVDVKNSDLFGVYPDENGEKIRFAWVITEDVTKYVGGVRFSVHLMCFDDDSNVAYDWTSGVCNDIVVVESVNVDGTITKENADIIRQWRNQLMFNVEFEPSNMNEQTILDKLVMTRTWDGKVFESSSLRGPQGIQGEQGVQGVQGEVGLTPTISIGEVTMQSADNPNPEVTVSYNQVDGVDDKTNPKLNFTLPTPSCDKVTTMGDDEELYFFKGTKAEYDQLTETEKKNVFAIITDDVYSTDQLEQDMAALKDANVINRVTAIEQKTIPGINVDITNLNEKIDETVGSSLNAVHKYEWSEGFEIVKIDEPLVFASMPEVWDPQCEYEYFNEDGSPYIIDPLTGSNKELVPAPNSGPCPSLIPVNDNGDPIADGYWWGANVISSNGYSITIFNRDGMCQTQGLIFQYKDEDTFINRVWVIVDGERKQIPLDGTMVSFINTKTDTITPDMYDGDKIRRSVWALKYTDVTGVERVGLYGGTSVYSDGWKINPKKDIWYDYDPQNKYDAPKVVKHSYALGAKSLSVKVEIEYCKHFEKPLLPRTAIPFNQDISKFKEYLRVIGIPLKVGDYLLDVKDDLYKITSVPYDGINAVQLTRITRDYTNPIRKFFWDAKAYWIDNVSYDIGNGEDQAFTASEVAEICDSETPRPKIFTFNVAEFSEASALADQKSLIENGHYMIKDVRANLLNSPSATSIEILNEGKLDLGNNYVIRVTLDKSYLGGPDRVNGISTLYLNFDLAPIAFVPDEILDENLTS